MLWLLGVLRGKLGTLRVLLGGWGSLPPPCSPPTCSGTLCTPPVRLSPVDGDDAAEDAGSGTQEGAISQGQSEFLLSLGRGEKGK